MIRLTPPGISILPVFPKLEPGEETFVKFCTEINRQLSVSDGSRHEACRNLAIPGEEKKAELGAQGGSTHGSRASTHNSDL